MAGMDSKNLSAQDLKILGQNNLSATDVYTYKASLSKNTWKEGLPETTVKQVESIANNFYDSKVATTFDQAQEAFAKVKSVGSGTSATDNQALIYAFAKAMDPTSVVRE